MATYGTFSYTLRQNGEMTGTKVRSVYGLCDVLEVEIAIVAEDPTSKRDKQLGKRGVHIHEVGGLDVLGRELAKVHFIESAARTRI